MEVRSRYNLTDMTDMESFLARLNNETTSVAHVCFIQALELKGRTNMRVVAVTRLPAGASSETCRGVVCSSC